MPSRTAIVTQDLLPEAVFDVLRAGFPDVTEDPRPFFVAHPDSIHALVFEGDSLVAHACVIPRTLYVAGRGINTAYVEYVAAEPRRQGYGSEAMRALEAEIRRRAYSFAALATGTPEFYESLDWRRWRGPTAYRKDGEVVPAPDEIIMVRDFGASANLDKPLECDWRPIGDIW